MVGSLVSISEVRGSSLALSTTKNLSHTIYIYRHIKEAWIGYNDIKKEGKWEWCNPSQKNNKYKNWKKGEPNNAGNEDCAAVVKGEWTLRFT